MLHPIELVGEYRLLGLWCYVNHCIVMGVKIWALTFALFSSRMFHSFNDEL
jgi:hypothetical protein